MKKTISVVVSVLLVLSLGMTAVAADLLPQNSLILTNEPGTPALEEELPVVQKAYPVRMTGTIIAETEDSITVQNAVNEDDTVVLHLQQSTYIVDAVSGIPASIQERTGDKVIVYYGPAATLSLPPQSNAVVIAVNVSDQSTSPHYAVVESLTMNDDRSAVKVLTDNGSLYITINRETPLSPYRTRELATIDNIQEGTELLLWYEMVAMSYPGQTSALKTVILPYAPALAEQIILSTDAGVASINGEETNLLSIRYYPGDETPLVPLRQVCEALGYEVKWITGTDQVEVSKGSMTVLLRFSQPVYKVNGHPVAICHAPLVDNGTTFVPTCFFTDVLGVAVNETTQGV